ncbi:MAG TPA: PKD domain-containing protein, partial [Fibrella sp.]
LALFAGFRSNAQLPTCVGPSAGYLYSFGAGVISYYDPTQPTSATNPGSTGIPLPPGGGSGLAVAPNINGTGPSPTFYTTVGGNYYYYNGTGWTNTGHTAGAVNIGGGGAYLYGLIGGTGELYRYDGTGNAILLLTIPGFGLNAGNSGPFDVSCDCAGNFYILKTQSTPQFLRKYSPTGVLLQSWTVTGVPLGVLGGAGLCVLGNTVYFDASNTFYTGTIGATNVAFTSAPLTFASNDMASCPSGGVASSVQASIDTGYYCGTGPGVIVSVTGTAPFNWTVIGGPAVVTPSTGSVVTITASSTSLIRVQGQPGPCGGADDDTVLIIVPTATVDAGLNSTALGCGVYRDTLSGTVLSQTPGLTYNIAWTPVGTVVSGGNTLTPIVAPTANTIYTFNYFTIPSQGGCIFTDTVRVTVQDVSVDAGFIYNIRYGCSGDTVDFLNSSTSLAGGMTYRWDFGDGTSDTARNPTHFYPTPGTYPAKLVVTNGPCKDSLVASLPLDHPLDAAFTVSADSLCQGDTVFFTNNTIATTRNGIAPRYFWDFGDGTTDSVENPKHYYAAGGVYVVTLAVRDFVPCRDTARDTIVVDSLPHVRILLDDTALCEGEATSFAA